MELCARVDDWKNHDIHHFGDLLLHGVFSVITGKSDIEKEVNAHVFIPCISSSLSSEHGIVYSATDAPGCQVSDLTLTYSACYENNSQELISFITLVASQEIKADMKGLSAHELCSILYTFLSEFCFAVKR